MGVAGVEVESALRWTVRVIGSEYIRHGEMRKIPCHIAQNVHLLAFS